MFKFITRRPFWVNLLVALLLVGVIVYVAFTLLGVITRHGQYEKVPSVVGKSIQEATSQLESKGFVTEVLDSIWDENLPRLAVARQSPEGDEMVKTHRRIYLTVNRSQPPLVEVPNMVGLSFRNAELYLKQLGLKLGDTTRRPDIAKDAILEQSFGGEVVKGGARVFVGSAIDFVLGSGVGEDEFDVPNLLGSTYAQAKAQLMNMGLNTAALIIDADVRDTAKAIVYKQGPAQYTHLPDGGGKQINRIRQGQSVDLWLGTKMVTLPTDSTDEKGY
ncbi:MAG: PASTA domain-containing protein [Bacteroidetes bacterium]|nr:MAG: PASTA domain-containing protein [Bacteroidota bacterium]